MSTRDIDTKALRELLEPASGNLDLIVAAVNALPALLDAAEERDRLRALLTPPHPLEYAENDSDFGRECTQCGCPVPSGYRHAHAGWCSNEVGRLYRYLNPPESLDK